MSHLDAREMAGGRDRVPLHQPAKWCKQGFPLMSSSTSRLRTTLRWLAAIGFVAAGANHFRDPAMYGRIIPPGFPNPPLLVAASGVCEMAGGLGLLIKPLRRAAGWGLIALLLAVFPANVYMALRPRRFADCRSSTTSLDLRYRPKW